MAKLLGVVLVVVGLVLAVVTVVRMDCDDAWARTGVVAASESATSVAEVALPLVAAVSFASGIVLLVVGVGRWSHPRRRSAPGDAVVYFESHHKMDHVYARGHGPGRSVPGGV